MFTSRCSSVSLLALTFLCLSTLLDNVWASDMAYCSTINTADTPKNSSIYQSNGLCFGFCVEEYAFAVVQYDGCWCSNYAPSSVTDGCDKACPGYGFESCGGTGTFGYIQLRKKPLGVQGAAQVPSESKEDTTSVVQTPDPVTTTTVISPPSLTTSTSATSSSSSSSSTKSITTTTSDGQRTSSTWTPTPIISLETVTGQIRTVTVTPSQPPGSQNANQLPKSTSKDGLSTGAAVGLTIGLVALVAIVCSLIYFCMKKRRQQREQEEGFVETRDASQDSVQTMGGPIPSRSMSEHSRYVLGTDGRQVVEAWEPHEDRDAPGSRKSRLMPVDPRLDPYSAVYQRGENKSRESFNTLRDDQDYSRRVHQHAPILRATNPD